MRTNYPPRFFVVLLAAIVGAGVTTRLGVWQLSRAAQKEDLQAQLDARSALPPLDATALAREPLEVQAQQHRRVALRGHWIDGRTVYLDNRQMNGRPGFFVLTPLQLADADGVVLVQRGWVPRNVADRTALPPIVTPSGEVALEGSIAPGPSRLLGFEAGERGPIRQNLDLAEFVQETGLPLRPLAVLQRESPGTAPDGMLRQWPRPAVDVQKHYGYAFQWFALAALITGLYVWFQLVRPRLRARG